MSNTRIDQSVRLARRVSAQWGDHAFDILRRKNQDRYGYGQSDVLANDLAIQRQVEYIYDHLTKEDLERQAGDLALASYGLHEG